MKKNILITLMALTLSFNIQAVEKKEFKLTSHVQSVLLHEKDRYKVQFMSLASSYYADKKFHSCLVEAMNKKKAVEIKSTARTHEITSCKMAKK